MENQNNRCSSSTSINTPRTNRLQLMSYLLYVWCVLMHGVCRSKLRLPYSRWTSLSWLHRCSIPDENFSRSLRQTYTMMNNLEEEVRVVYNKAQENSSNPLTGCHDHIQLVYCYIGIAKLEHTLIPKALLGNKQGCWIPSRINIRCEMALTLRHIWNK